MTNTTSREYTVTGMSCSHCVNAVRQEVADIAGVQGADVDLASGHLTVTGTFTDDEIRTAVSRAGYELADR